MKNLLILCLLALAACSQQAIDPPKAKNENAYLRVKIINKDNTVIQTKAQSVKL